MVLICFLACQWSELIGSAGKLESHIPPKFFAMGYCITWISCVRQFFIVYISATLTASI